MARPHILANGRMLIGINRNGQVHDVYYPYIGLENHSLGKGLRHMVGVWVDGRISWLRNGGEWHIEFMTSEHSLHGYTRAENSGLGIVLTFDDAVDSDIDVFYRSITIANTRDDVRDVHLFMHQAFKIGDGRSNTDTVQYLPDNDAILHYRGPRAFVIGGETDNGTPFDQHSVGLFGIEGREGTWRDADDGNLENGSVEHGMVDSTIRFRVEMDGRSAQHVYYWMAAGTTLREALTAHKTVKEQGVPSRMRSTAQWWRKWLEPASQQLENIPKAYRPLYMRSLMIIKAHTDREGAIIASSDSAMLNYSRDAYAYCWPRDAAHVLWPLMRLGYREEIENFLAFAKKSIHPNGYLMHKYRADGALGSSWHPYEHGDRTAPPIQEDETALTLFLFCEYYHINPSQDLLDKYYSSFARPMANFLARYVDPTTGLPKPTYDLWEERFMVSTYTTALVIAALYSAAELADSTGHVDDAVKWRSVASDMHIKAQQKLYNEEKGYIINGLTPHDGDKYTEDTTLNMASIYGSFMFGLFNASGKEITNSLKEANKRFMASRDRPGVPRYENDNYHRIGIQPPNWWFVTTLWTAQHSLEIGDQEKAEEVMNWVTRHASESLTLSEQISPSDGSHLSVDPLVWSHAEYVSTLLDLIGNKKK
ncbi:glycoside hydrolase family 15 protein [Candidatus Nomurabacteria bacterium]|nr:glycoside hydrolase family 15 protein [Candidatus Nomurabacteria bacterium]